MAAGLSMNQEGSLDPPRLLLDVAEQVFCGAAFSRYSIIIL